MSYLSRVHEVPTLQDRDKNLFTTSEWIARNAVIWGSRNTHPIVTRNLRLDQLRQSKLLLERVRGGPLDYVVNTMTDKKGRLAWGNIVQANEGMDSRTFRVTTAKQKKELAKYMGRPNYTYHTYCQSHQEWHLESHKADMPLHALDMCNDFLAGIQCEALKVPIEVIKQNKAHRTNFDSL
jgi:hypothetical protein